MKSKSETLTITQKRKKIQKDITYFGKNVNFAYAILVTF